VRAAPALATSALLVGALASPLAVAVDAESGADGHGSSAVAVTAGCHRAQHHPPSGARLDVRAWSPAEIAAADTVLDRATRAAAARTTAATPATTFAIPGTPGAAGAGGASLDTTERVRVHVHVIRSRTEGAVPRARVRRQVDVLRDAFGGRQSPSAAQSPFRFRMASLDTTVNGRWYRMSEGSVAERRAKRALHRGNADDLNLYVVSGRRGVLGWASQPTEYATDPAMDGVVITRSTLPGGSRGPYSSGDAAVHETGHWFGLFHTFAGRCGGRGDLVADTAPERRPSYGCPVGRDTCTAPGRDPVHNFMDYSYDGCMDRFTRGQVRRMLRGWAVLRSGGG